MLLERTKEDWNYAIVFFIDEKGENIEKPYIEMTDMEKKQFFKYWRDYYSHNETKANQI